MRKNKALAIALAGVLLMGSLAGCGKSSEGQGSETPNANAGKKNKYGWLVPEKTLKMSVGYGQATPSEFEKDAKIMIDELKKEFNIELDAQVWETDYTERQSLMLATQQYPDVLTGLNAADVKNWTKANAAIDLAPIVESSAPEIKDQMGKYYARYIDKDGKLFALPNMWGYWEAPQVAPTVRQDWYKEIGSPDVSTPDKYYAALKAMVEKHPKGADGKKTYALGMYNSTASFISMYGGMYGFYSGWDIDSNNQLTNWTMTDKGLDMTLWLNQIQRDGLLDPDSFTQKSDELKSKYANERFAGWLGAWWQAWNFGHEQWQDTKKDWTNDQRYIYTNVTAEGVDHATYSGEASMGYYSTIITNKAKNKAADILKWFAYEMTDEGMRFVGWGVPNTEFSGWDLKDDGTWESRKDYEKKRIENVNFPFDELEATGTMLLNTTVRLMKDDQSFSAYWDVNFRGDDPAFKQMYDAMEGTYYDAAYLKAIAIDPADPLANKKQQIDDITKSQWAAAVMAPTAEECTSIFKAMQSELKKNGIDEYTNFYNTEYNNNLKNWGK